MTHSEFPQTSSRWQQARARRAQRRGGWTVTDVHTPVPVLRQTTNDGVPDETAALLNKLATIGGKVTVTDSEGRSKIVNFV